MKETITKLKQYSIKWEKIFISDISDKKLISKIYKGLIQLNIKKNQMTLLKMGRRFE